MNANAADAITAEPSHADTDTDTPTTAPAITGSPKDKRHAQASGNVADSPANPAPTDTEQTRADLLDLAESAAELATRAEQLGMRQTAHRTRRLGQQLRAARTRVVVQPAHLPAALAYVELAADELATVAVRVGAASHRAEPIR